MQSVILQYTLQSVVCAHKSRAPAVLWTPQSDGQALYIAYTRVSCIILAVLIMGLLSMLIYPQVASEQVHLLFPIRCSLSVIGETQGIQLVSATSQLLWITTFIGQQEWMALMALMAWG